MTPSAPPLAHRVSVGEAGPDTPPLPLQGNEPSVTLAADPKGCDEVVLMKRMKSGGGWAAIRYTLRMANRVGWRRLWKAMRTKNACKTCALGMGGQAGGMRNELGHWPEVCKKSLQAVVADMQAGVSPEFLERYS